MTDRKEPGQASCRRDGDVSSRLLLSRKLVIMYVLLV